MSLTRPELTGEEIRDVNVRYHDAAAGAYDSKWAIDYGETGTDQVLMKLEKALGRAPGRYQRALEIGAGTGYFTVNLLRTNVIGQATATDISGGMLERLAETAAELGLEVETARADAEDLPFEDASFDLVFGHAVLHHIPDLPRALRECRRVLVPGGTLAFMGEPSARGDGLAAIPKALGRAAGPAWRFLLRAKPKADRPAGESGRPAGGSGRPAGGSGRAEHASHDPLAHDLIAGAPAHDHTDLERLVDVHTFSPGELRDLAEAAGFEQVRVAGEELVASVYGWLLRSLEHTAEPGTIPTAWHRFAFRSYLALQSLDSRLLEPRLPAGVFYNLLLSGRRPDGP